MRRLLWIIMIVVIGSSTFLTPILGAQDATSLEYGQSVSGSISNDAPTSRYTFSGSSGDQIYISMFSTENSFPPAVTLLGPNGSVLGSVAANALGALLGPVELTVTGDYTIEAGRAEWESSATGNFILVLDTAATQELQANTALEGRLSGAGATAFFTYHGTANDLVGVHLFGSMMGMGVVSPNGEIIYSDYSDSGSLSRPLNRLPDTGDYTVVLQTANNEEGTDYSLLVTPVTPVPLDAGKPARGSMSTSAPAILTFRSAANKMLAINATISGMEDASYMAIIRDDDICCTYVSDYGSGPGGSMRIDPFLTPVDGVYYVLLQFDTDVPQDATYDYEVSLDASALATLALNTPINAKITPESGGMTFIYNGVTDELLRVTLEQTGGQGALGMRILSPEDEAVTFSGRNSRYASFDVILPMSGLYLFEVYNVDYNATDMEFTLSIERGG